MALFDTKKERAALILALLAVALGWALWPYVSGLLGAPVLYVLFRGMHRKLSKYMPVGLAAGLVILLAFLIIVLPGIWLIGMLVGQAQDVAAGLVNSTLLAPDSEPPGRAVPGGSPACLDRKGFDHVPWGKRPRLHRHRHPIHP